MALIKCVECGKEISDRADKCPNCGCPIDYIPRELPSEEQPVMFNCIRCNKPLPIGTKTCIYCNYNYDQSTPSYSKTRNKESGFGIASLIIMISGVFSGVFGIFLFILAAILGIIALTRKNRNSICATISLCILTIFFLAGIGLAILGSKTSERVPQKEIESTAIVKGEISEEERVDTSEEIENPKEQMESSLRLTAGTYVIGEDINVGKYNFYAVKGSGSILIYNTYEDYKNDKNGFESFQNFDLLANGASRGLLNEDVCTDKVMNLRLIHNQTLVIEDGVEITYEMSEKVSDNILNVGIYVIGDDIDAGKYDFKAIAGTGSVKIYNTYEEYQQDEYGFDAFVDYDLKEENASAGLTNEDIYSQMISNMRLEDGQCMVVDKGLVLEYTIK